jgi:hypothetical protein
MKTTTWHRSGAHAACVALGLAAFFAPKTAHAFNLGVGVIGTAGGNFLDKPSRTALDPDLYPGFGGFTGGGGLMVDGRFLDFLGLELDVIRSSDKGTGSVTFNVPGFSGKYDLKIGQSAWHLPILAKLAIPSPLVAPTFVLGPEIVFPDKANASFTGPYTNATVKQTASTYVMITGGVGIEIKLPLPVLDLRIPLGLRFSYAPGIPGTFDERVKVNPGGGYTYQSEWKFAVNGTLGAALYF